MADEPSGDGTRDPVRANPYEALDLNPKLSPRELTAELRERAEDLSPDERAEVQAAWQALTVSDSDRVQYTLFARPRTERGGDAVSALLRMVRAPDIGSGPTADEMIGRIGPRDLALPPLLELEPSQIEPTARVLPDSLPPMAADPLLALENVDDLD